MYGAILGDIIGQPYEFDARNYKGKDFPLFSTHPRFTDDTVMTVAVAEALILYGRLSDLQIKTALIDSMKRWGKRYGDAGYGGRFENWLFSDSREPYYSFGNGSAMRVSSVAWLYHSLPEVEHVAKLTAEVTHNHPEGIKGAQAVASAIFLARSGASKDDIREYVERKYSYDLHRSIGRIRPGYHMDATCQGSVPEAIIAFLEGKDYEDAVRTAVSIGGDSDTIACIAGAIAEGKYGIPATLKNACLQIVSHDISRVLNDFEMCLLMAREDENESVRDHDNHPAFQISKRRNKRNFPGGDDRKYRRESRNSGLQSGRREYL